MCPAGTPQGQWEHHAGRASRCPGCGNMAPSFPSGAGPQSSMPRMTDRGFPHSVGVCPRCAQSRSATKRAPHRVGVRRRSGRRAGQCWVAPHTLGGLPSSSSEWMRQLPRSPRAWGSAAVHGRQHRCRVLPTRVGVWPTSRFSLPRSTPPQATACKIDKNSAGSGRPPGFVTSACGGALPGEA